jgi:TonB family protein
MQEAVNSILLGRSREAEGLSRMITLSLGAHALFLVALAVVPSSWLTSEVERPERVTTISLGSPPGTQDTGGMTPQATRQVQEATADPRTVVRAPSATPEMVAPAEPKTTAAKPVPKPPDKSTTKKPATGKEVQIGPARADAPDAAQVPFGGLASSSAGGTGGVRIDGDFCCPEYIEAMKRAIHANWNQNIGARGVAEVKFTIRRDGVLTNIAISKSSGNPILDLESRKAVHATVKVPPLPDRFPEPFLPIYLTFEYKR